MFYILTASKPREKLKLYPNSSLFSFFTIVQAIDAVTTVGHSSGAHHRICGVGGGTVRSLGLFPSLELRLAPSKGDVTEPDHVLDLSLHCDAEESDEVHD